MDRLGAEAVEDREVVDVARVARFDDEADAVAEPGAQEVLRTAPRASSAGRAALSRVIPLSVITRISEPARTASSARASRASSAARRPASPDAASNVASSSAGLNSEAARIAAASSSRRTGCSRLRKCASPGSSRRSEPPFPRSIRSDMTAVSRSESIGGFVTCAKRCRKNA